jgi:hypothetical protein
MGNILSSFFNGIIINPAEAAGVVAAWGLLVCLGLYVRRARGRPDRLYEWAVWTYVCTSIVLSVALDGARLAQHFTPTPTFQAMGWSFLTSLVAALLTALIWPIYWVAALVGAIRDSGTFLYLLAVLVSAFAIGALISVAITFAVHGLPGGPARPPRQEGVDQI